MTDKFLRKILNITTILFAIILFGCVENSTSASTESETIVNETSSISAGNIFYSSFNAKSKVTIHVDVQVTNGDGVKIYLLDDYTQLINLLNNNYFNYNPALSSAYEVTSFNKSATLPAGNWYIAILNPNLLLSQTVRRTITALY